MIPNFIAEAWSELAIGLVFIALRLYFRYTQAGWRGLRMDDYLMVFAGILYVFETLAAHMIVAQWLGGANNSFTPEKRASLKPSDQEWKFAVLGSKAHIFGWFMYTGIIWTLKSCWTIYYSRMTDGISTMDVRIKLAWVLNGTTYMAALCMILFNCWPLHRQWQIYPDPGGNCYPGASKLNVTFITVINIVTDLFLMAIPIPIIYHARLSLKRKISLFLLFSGGHVVIVFSLLRCVVLVTVSPTTSSKAGPWSVRESFVAVLISNLPMVFPLFKGYFSTASSMMSSRQLHNTSYPLAEIKQTHTAASSKTHSARTNKKTRIMLHPPDIPNGTAWGSDEAIICIERIGGWGGRDWAVEEGEEG
ncbi:hypothetical protein EJ02DRAFT_478907 [Clathrospora elynae]|uniref:Rhodopsin domain-containing protein n=1 Tax=Clathrospora elynae TaxID=706981 RepID=A0A6A5SXH1_9PLEO|nr:hypothetical protein EJ02DRAFT_478907 [Clathrospora elynae]